MIPRLSLAGPVSAADWVAWGFAVLFVAGALLVLISDRASDPTAQGTRAGRASRGRRRTVTRTDRPAGPLASRDVAGRSTPVAPLVAPPRAAPGRVWPDDRCGHCDGPRGYSTHPRFCAKCANRAVA